MAEIDVKKKNRASGGWIIILLILLIVAIVLILDATESISTPNWIHNGDAVDSTSIHQTY